MASNKKYIIVISVLAGISLAFILFRDVTEKKQASDNLLEEFNKIDRSLDSANRLSGQTDSSRYNR